jgi:biotin carboxyl carrier protein
METAVRAAIDGEVAEVLAKPGAQADAQDLLVVLARMTRGANNTFCA